MKVKYVSPLLLTFVFINSTQSQGILNKIKDKSSGKESSNCKTTESNKTKGAWCDTGLVSNMYSLAYINPDNFSIMYDESRLAIGRMKNDYHLILKKRVDK